MTVYVRRSPCTVCGKNVYWDSDTKTVTCGCGTFKATYVNTKEFFALTGAQLIAELEAKLKKEMETP
jgi:hypothetical protein